MSLAKNAKRPCTQIVFEGGWRMRKFTFERIISPLSFLLTTPTKSFSFGVAKCNFLFTRPVAIGAAKHQKGLL